VKKSWTKDFQAEACEELETWLAVGGSLLVSSSHAVAGGQGKGFRFGRVMPDVRYAKLLTVLGRYNRNMAACRWGSRKKDVNQTPGIKGRQMEFS